MCTAGFELRPVTTLSDALAMRMVRNECRDYMTNDTSYVSAFRQFGWWRKIRKDPTWHLYVLWYNGCAIGYGIIRIKNHMHWVSGGIIEQSRSHGFGRCLFARLTELAANTNCAYLEVLTSNVRAIRLYSSLGYRSIGELRRGVLTMRADPG